MIVVFHAPLMEEITHLFFARLSVLSANHSIGRVNYRGRGAIPREQVLVPYFYELT